MNNDPSGHCVQCDNWWMREYITGDHPWTATPFSQNPTQASLARLDAWTGLLSTIASVDYSPRGDWLDEAILSNKKYISKSEAEAGIMISTAITVSGADTLLMSKALKGVGALEKTSGIMTAERNVTNFIGNQENALYVNAFFSKDDVAEGYMRMFHGTQASEQEIEKMIENGMNISVRGGEKPYAFLTDGLPGASNYAYAPGSRISNVLELHIPEGDLVIHPLIANQHGGFYGISPKSTLLRNVEPVFGFDDASRAILDPSTIKGRHKIIYPDNYNPRLYNSDKPETMPKVIRSKGK